MHSDVDPVHQLEHDHVHLNRMVASLREALDDTLRGEREMTQLRDDLIEFIELVRDEVYPHFDREETGLFPYIGELFADLQPRIESLSTAHDRICGVASRLEFALSQDIAAFEASFDTIVALFARFDANYARHAREEQELIRSLAGRLTEPQRREVARLLAEL
jgi:hemerythrin-like domain-containing protein